MQQHRSVRNQANNLYRKLKNAYFRSRIENYRSSPWQLWSTINHVTGCQQRRVPPSLPLRELTDHFKVLLHAKLPLTITPAGPLREEGFVTFLKITVSEVESLLLQLNSCKAGGPDDIKPL